MNIENTDKSSSLAERASKIKLLLMDCDGVMTDGRLYFSEQGETIKVFHVRDGQGLVLWHKAGFKSGIISGRDAGEIIKNRAAELGISYVIVKSKDKADDFNLIIAETDVSASEVAFIGDDVGDIEILKLVGFPVAVADAVLEVIDCAAYVTRANGGSGAVREVIDLLLDSRKSALSD